VLSEESEHCILNHVADFLMSSDNQFGLKKKIRCTRALYSKRRLTEQYAKNGSAVDKSSLHLPKALNRMPHHGLFIKLMQHTTPVQLLSAIEDWFWSC
jgi:hypothetical protein